VRRLAGLTRTRPDLLVLQGSSFCNVACRYCYVPGRDDRRRMPTAVIEAVARNILRDRHAPDTLDVAWHAGEPLALPHAWLDAACATLAEGARAGQRLRFGVQTNAMLLDDAWIDVLSRHRFTVGVSIDGPRRLHDAQRVTRSGSGTFDAAMAGIERLREAGLRFDVIAVLTRDALDAPDEIFEFFAALSPRSLGFNVEEIEGSHTRSTLEADGTRAAFGNFMTRFLARHADAGAPFRFRALDTLAGPHDSGARNDQTRPLSIVTVAADGSLSTFSPELIGAPSQRYARFVFGNVRDGGLDQVLRHPAFRRLARDVRAGQRACRTTCGYYGLCGGGAPGNKVFETGSAAATETLYCRLMVKETVEAVLGHLERRRAGAAAQRAA